MNEDKQEKWNEFDAILKDNRVRDFMETEAEYHPAVHFALNLGGDPWARGWGMFAHDPLFTEWQEGIAAYRREREAQDEAHFADVGAASANESKFPISPEARKEIREEIRASALFSRQAKATTNSQ